MERLELENSMRKALDEDQFVVYYQPTIDIHKNEIVSVEALLRWEHPDKGIIKPVDFVPLAEDCGLIVPIGEKLVRTAARQLKAWKDEGLENQNVSINIAPRQFRDMDVLALFKEVIHENALEPSNFTIEITESALIDNVGEVEKVLNVLSGMGVTIALDDFGTGFASLAYLKDFPVDIVKIDRIFIAGTPDSREDTAIVEAIAGLTRGLKLRLLAEGIENDRQLQMLKGLGCQLAQGYYWSKALPADQYEQFYLNRFYNIG
jgi:EAL domain-containing protein (putative c-di-GMP-specific phosphodiesterase class I)